MSSRNLRSVVIGCSVVLFVLTVASFTAAAQGLPPLPGQHPWSHRGQGNGRSGFSPAIGPEAPVLEPPEWPYDQVNGDVVADPVVGGEGGVYFGSTAGTFYALHRSAPTTQNLLNWTFEAGAPIRSAAAIKNTRHGDDPVRVYFTTDGGHVYSLDTGGNLIWDYALPAPVAPQSAPALTRDPLTNRVRLYLATDGGIYALEENAVSNLPTVSVLWQESSVQSSRSVAISPDGERIYATAGSTFYVLDADLIGGSQILDQVSLGGQLTGPVVDEDDRAYVGSDNGTVYQIDAPSATVLQSDNFGGAVTVEPAVAPDEQLGFVSGDVLHLTHRSLLTRTWRFTPTVQSPSWQFASEIAVDGAGTVFVTGDDARAHAIRNGSQAWEQPVSGTAFTAPALTREGRLYVGTDASSLHAIQSEPSFQTAFDGDVQDDTTLDIYTIRSAYGITGSLKRRTDDPAADVVPAYSTLGQLVAFASGRHGIDQDVFLGTAGARSLQNVTVAAPGTPFATDETDETDPAFSPTDQHARSLLPDGTRYLGVTTGFDGNWTLFFIDLDTLFRTGTITGTDLIDFLNDQGATGTSSQVPLQQAQAAFSPDGRWLAYGACVETITEIEYQLRVVDLVNDTQSIVATESTAACDVAASFHPFFSPDSRYLVYESGATFFVTDDMGQPGAQIGGVFEGQAPAWSPDGTEIVFHSFLFTSEPHLRTVFGSQYISSTQLIAPLSSDGAYHPRHLPVPETRIPRCDVQDNLSPTSQQPGELVTIRGCGFDVRFPENNTVIFPRADGPGVIRTEALSTAVEFSTGLGVITAEVPLLAGDGQIAVHTPFGNQALTDTFQVEPLATALRMSESVHNGFIRVMGYGFETGAPSSYGVRFSGAASATAVTPADVRVETCSPPETPCSLSRLPGGEIGWLEVQVPGNAADGQVIVERTIGTALPASIPPDTLTLLSPQVGVSPDTGSAGDPQANISPVTFDFEGSGFPYDPYFNYTQVDLYQVDPAMANTSLGVAALDATNTFLKTDLDVRPNSGGRLSMEARLPAQQASGTLVSASTPFTTPLKDLPIVFVPGTSGTFLENSGNTFRHERCAAFAACKVGAAIGSVTSGGLLGAVANEALARTCGAHDPNDYQGGENVWLNDHALIHILVGCSNWLDAIKLEPNTNQGVFPRIQIGSVMDEVKTPPGAPNKDIYKSLLDFIQNDMNRTLVPYGSSCPAGETDCLYLFNQDWRLGMDDETQRLDSLINQALQETGQPRVLIVTHSYGGPTANYYLRTVSGAPSKVDQVITLGGGHMGVVRPYKALEIGDSWEIEFLEVLRLKKKNVQEIARNWPTAYWQLPQSNWFTNPNDICPKEKGGNRDCSWVDADWDATVPIRQSSPPGELNTSSSTYAFIEDSVAYNPFRGRIGNKKYAQNVNSGKFQTAQNQLLDLGSTQNESTLSCSETGAAGLGDWRCGTQGVFFQRIVGFGTDTTVRVKFADKRICLLQFNLFGDPVRICFKNRWIEPVKTSEGDSTIPLRSAVGILSQDGTFDTRDSRIWALDGAGNSDFDIDGSDEDSKFHSSLPRIPSIHKFIQYAAQGKVTDISQIPADWPNADWPFMVPCGVPDALHAPSGTPTDSNCYGTSVQSAAAAAETTPDYWAFEMVGDAPLYVRDEAGDGAGPLPELPDGAIASLPGVDYERNPGFTRMRLPYDSGVYTVTIEGDPSDSDVTRLDDLVQMQIFPSGDGAFTETLHTFLSVPISDTTEAHLVWDTANPPEKPTLHVDFAGDGEVVSLTPDTTLSGAAATDTTPPTSTITVDAGLLTIEATDEGGAGIHQIVYGTDRGRVQGQLYTGTVALPADTTYVWAFAADRAGNTQHQDTVYTTCDLPTDFDGDGQVATDDVRRAASRWSSSQFLPFDLNRNDHVDVGDVEQTAANLGASCGDATRVITATPEQSEAVIRVESPPSTTVGSVFTAAVALDNPTDLAGFEATFAYNPFMLRLRNVALADTLAETGRMADLLGPISGSSLKDGSQTVHFGGYTYGDAPGVDQGGVVARLTFEAIASGEGSLAVTYARLADVEGALTIPSTEDDTIQVAPRFTVFLPTVLKAVQP